MTRRPLILFQKQHCFSQGSWCHLFVMLKAVTSLNPFPFLLGWGAYYLFKQSPKRLRSVLVMAVVVSNGAPTATTQITEEPQIWGV